MVSIIVGRLAPGGTAATAAASAAVCSCPPETMRYLRCDSARCQRLHALLSSNGCGQCRPASRRAGMNRPAPQRIPCQVSLCCAACGHQQQAFIVQRAPEGRTNPGRITALRPCRAQWPWPLYKLRCCVAGIYQKNRKKGTHVCVDITFKIERTSCDPSPPIERRAAQRAVQPAHAAPLRPLSSTARKTV